MSFSGVTYRRQCLRSSSPFVLKKQEARAYFYREFPEHYVWDKDNRQWNKRKKRDVIGRVNGANPAEGERYYLRLLLNHVRGPPSFADLLTVDIIRYSTFKESAVRRGLLESDNSISECLDEATTFQMPYALRRLFATILVYCEPTYVKKLWDDYFEAMSEDFEREEKNSQIFKITSYDLPAMPQHFVHDTNPYPKELRDEMSVEIPSEDQSAELNLNPDQLFAFKKILDKVDSNERGVFFIDGPGGTGKTYLYRSLLANIRLRNMIALATATSGVAAAIMPGGRTAHSRFKIPISANESTMCNIAKQSGTADLLCKARLIIWDEAPMAKRWAIETLDMTLQDIMNNQEPFGGKVIVFGGDFRQVLPVVPRGTREETINASLVASYLWPSMERLTLTKNMRARADPTFIDFLLRVGNGDEPTNNNDMIVIPEGMIIEDSDESTSEQKLIDSVFPLLKKVRSRLAI